MRPHLFLGLLDHFDLHHSRRDSDLQSGPLAHLRHRLGSTHPRDGRLEHHPQHTPLLDTRPRYIRLPHSFPGRTDLLGRPLERRLPQHTPLEDTRLHYSLPDHMDSPDDRLEHNLLHTPVEDTHPHDSLPEHMHPRQTPLEHSLLQHNCLKDTRLHYSLLEHRRPPDNSLEQNLLHSCLQDTRPRGTLEHIRPDHGCILGIRHRHRPSLPGSRP